MKVENTGIISNWTFLEIQVEIIIMINMIKNACMEIDALISIVDIFTRKKIFITDKIL